MILDAVYVKMAVSINDWENHRTQTLYEDSLIVKLFVFNFVNNYFSLFYTAFVKAYASSYFGGVYRDEPCKDTFGAPYFVNGENNCMPELTSMLMSIMITRLTVRANAGLICLSVSTSSLVRFFCRYSRFDRSTIFCPI